MFQVSRRNGQAFWLVSCCSLSVENFLIQLPGDTILVQPVGSDGGKWFEGYVHVVRQYEVGMKLNRSFAPTASQRFKIRFKLNRYPLRRQHQALDTALHPERLLFPLPPHILLTNVPSTTQIRHMVHNRLIAGNLPQLQAVSSVARAPPGSPPFVIFGP